MKYLIYFGLFIAVASCNKKKPSETSKHDHKKNSLVILASSCYSKTFLRSLKKVNYAHGPVFIGAKYTNGKDTFPFYNVLKYNFETVFTYNAKDTSIQLSTNQHYCSSVSFVLKGTIKEKQIYEKGLADLSSLFWLGSETDEDELGNISPAMDYYSNSSNVDHIRIVGFDNRPKFIRLTLRNHEKSLMLKVKSN